MQRRIQRLATGTTLEEGLNLSAQQVSKLIEKLDESVGDSDEDAKVSQQKIDSFGAKCYSNIPVYEQAVVHLKEQPANTGLTSAELRQQMGVLKKTSKMFTDLMQVYGFSSDRVQEGKLLVNRLVLNKQPILLPQPLQAQPKASSSSSILPCPSVPAVAAVNWKPSPPGTTLNLVKAALAMKRKASVELVNNDPTEIVGAARSNSDSTLTNTLPDDAKPFPFSSVAHSDLKSAINSTKTAKRSGHKITSTPNKRLKSTPPGHFSVAVSRIEDKIDKAIAKKTDVELCKLLIGLQIPGIASKCRNLHVVIRRALEPQVEISRPFSLLSILKNLSVRFVLKNFGLPEIQLSRFAKALTEKRKSEFRLTTSDHTMLKLLRDDSLTIGMLFERYDREESIQHFLSHALKSLRQLISFLGVLCVVKSPNAEEEPSLALAFSIVLSSISDIVRSAYVIDERDEQEVYVLNSVPLGSPIFIKSDRDVRRYW